MGFIQLFDSTIIARLSVHFCKTPGYYPLIKLANIFTKFFRSTSNIHHVMTRV